VSVLEKTILKKAVKPDYKKQQIFSPPKDGGIRRILLDIEEETTNGKTEIKKAPEIKVNKKEGMTKELEMIYGYAPTTEDHRHRLLHFLLVPRLVLLGYTDKEVRAECKKYIESTFGGKSYDDYEYYVENSIRRTREGRWFPWRIETFLEYFPDAARWFKK